MINRVQFPEADAEVDCLLTIKFLKDQNVAPIKVGDMFQLHKLESTQVFESWTKALCAWQQQSNIERAPKCIIENSESGTRSLDEEVQKILDITLAKPNSPMQRLNPIQQDLLRQALTKEFLMLMGHPGTGKTEWICAFLHCLDAAQDVKKVLITAPTNATINVVCAAFTKLYQTTVVRPCPGQLELPDELIKYKVTKTINAAVLDSAKFVFCTCVHSVGPMVGKHDFDVIIVDEASQSPEPDLLCALQGRTSKQIILVGDPFQNSPIALSNSKDLKRSDHGTPLFPRKTCL